MTQFNNEKVQELALKLSESLGNYEEAKAVFNEIIDTVKDQDGRVQGNSEGEVFGGEYKSTDNDGDFVTCSIIGKTITYQRTSTINDKDGNDDGVFAFKAVDNGAEILYTSHLTDGGNM